ncbi:MAG: FecR family protein [Achromobacter sp.]|uniref:FecR family protein n=1 Tax=Achromobacter sp. TaxID=134375 RepID=UPI003CFE84F8
MTQAPIPDAIAEQAALWVVRLSAADVTEREAARRELAAWARQSPAHAAAARGMRRVVAQMRELRGAAAHAAGPARAGFDAAFAHAGKRRAHRLRVAIGALLFAAVAGWPVLQAYPVAYLLADARSAPGQWRSRVLEDGSRITLAGSSAVNLAFDPRRRELELVQGQVLVEVAKDAARPFVVRTGEARLTALGTRYVVARHDAVTTLTMIESQVRVDAVHGSQTQPVVVRAGQRVSVSAQGVGPVTTVDAREVAQAWRLHQLVAHDRPLTDVLDELNRHRPGWILYDGAALAGIRMAVVLPLDDPDRALRLLAESVPGLTLRFASSYLVWVGRTVN